MKKILVTFTICLATLSGIFLQSCAPTKEIADKSGAQLWGENCNRCHNAPSMDQYNKDQWDVTVTHMKIRAMITDAEAQKILAFLQGKN
jgi:cytochrome c1